MLHSCAHLFSDKAALEFGLFKPTLEWHVFGELWCGFAWMISGQCPRFTEIKQTGFQTQILFVNTM